MKNEEYWMKRFEQLEAAQTNKGVEYYNNLTKQYTKAIASVEKDLAKWYTRYATENGISLTEAKRLLNSRELAEFRMDVKEYIKKGKSLNPKWAKQLEAASTKFHVSRLEALMVQMQQQAELVCGGQLDDLDALARKIYTDGYYHTAYEIQKGIGVGWDLMALDTNKIDKLISKPWAADGKNFSERIWGNRTQLVNELENTLTQSIIRGQSPKKVIAEIAQRFNVSKSRAGALVMTESAFFASAAQRDCFNDLDVERFEVVATLDSHTSETCRHMDGKVLPISEYKPGVTAPPFHVRCRSTTVPYFDDEFTEGEQRAARDADGKYYTVPANMKYEEWKAAFVDGGSKEGLVLAVASSVNLENVDTLTAVKQEIIDKHNGIVNEQQKEEFDAILSKHTQEDLEFYNGYADYVKGNDYNYSGGAHYSPYYHKVNMDLTANTWEKHTGYSYNAAWKTKFHEEFHQIDNLLGNTELAKSVSGDYFLSKFTATNTVSGQKLIAAIEQDILNFINKAIEEYNVKNGAEIKKLKNLGRISKEAHILFFRKLRAEYSTTKQKAQISMFTDMMGLATKNRLPPHGNGFWGHDASYNKDRGKDGATSETWATFGSYYYYYDEETKKVLMEIMPNTLKEYESLLKKVVAYCKDNPLKYR